MVGQSTKRKRSFALVLTMFLVALLAATGTGLALMAAAESVTAAWTARHLDHRLAVDSLLVCLPELLRAQPAMGPSGPDESQRRRLTLPLADCEIECEIRSDKGKLHLGSASPSDRELVGLRELAARHGLPEDNVKPLPIVYHGEKTRLPDFVWFDQIIHATEFEEVFRWSFPRTDDTHNVERAAWSDLISFWDADGESVLALEVETRIARDLRRWYLVVSIVNSEVRVLYRGSV